MAYYVSIIVFFLFAASPGDRKPQVALNHAELSMVRFAPWAAALGLIALLVAAATYFVQGQFGMPVQVALVVGVVGLAAGGAAEPFGADGRGRRARQTRYGANSLIMVLALLGSLVLINYLVVRNPQRWDLTENQANTLRPGQHRWRSRRCPGRCT